MKSNAIAILAAMAAGSTNAFSYKNSVRPDKVQGFEWKDPFGSDVIGSFNPSCETRASFDALEYTLHDLAHTFPQGLKTWAQGLKKVFSGREYPGGWTGIDRHLHDRTLLLMEYDKIPLHVRQWIEDEERTDGKGKALFAVFEKPKQDEDELESVVEFPIADKIDRSKDKQKVAIFSPGALYGILPLWAAEASQCKDILLDLDNYKSEPTDGGVVAWVEPTYPEGDKMRFIIDVQSVKKRRPQDEAKETGFKEEL